MAREMPKRKVCN